jgi:hypothetical protein
MMYGIAGYYARCGELREPQATIETFNGRNEFVLVIPAKAGIQRL